MIKIDNPKISDKMQPHRNPMEAPLSLAAPLADDPVACARFFAANPEKFLHLDAEAFQEFRTTSWQALREARRQRPTLRLIPPTPGDAA